MSKKMFNMLLHTLDKKIHSIQKMYMNLDKALAVLGLSEVQGLTPLKLKNLYRELAKDKHPDKTGGNNKDFVELREAYAFLGQYLDEHPELQGTDEGRITTIDDLSKEDLLEKYYADTRSLELRVNTLEEVIESQSKVFTDLREDAKGSVTRFEEQKSGLEKEFNTEIKKLEQQYQGGWIQKLLFFLPQLKDSEYWSRYNTIRNDYKLKFSQLELEFSKKMITTYGTGLHLLQGAIEPQETSQTEK